MRVVATVIRAGGGQAVIPFTWGWRQVRI